MLDGVSERAFEVLEQGIYYVERLGAGAKMDWGFLAGNNPLGAGYRGGFDSSTSRPPKTECWRSLGNASG